MMERKRKFFLVAPALVTPFIVFILWILGIVGSESAQGQSDAGRGLNLSLPSAVASKDSTWSKLQFYEQADRDSAKLRQQMKQDPFYNRRLDDPDVEEQKVNQRLEEIQQELARKPEKRRLDDMLVLGRAL